MAIHSDLNKGILRNAILIFVFFIYVLFQQKNATRTMLKTPETQLSLEWVFKGKKIELSQTGAPGISVSSIKINMSIEDINKGTAKYF